MGKSHRGLLQRKCSADPAANLDRHHRGIREAAARGAQIVCLEELFCSQYFCREENPDLFDLAEPIPGPTTEALSKLARRTRVVIVASLFERRAAGPVSQHGRRARRRRLVAGHLPQDAHPRRPALLREVLFHAGRPGLPQFRYALRPHWRAGLLGPVVSRRRAAFHPARREHFFYPTAIGWHPSEKAEFGAAQLDAWRTIQRSHAIANGIFVAAVNRVGFEGPPDKGIEFWGSSFVADPFGQLIAEASTDKEETLIVECDPRRMEEVRRNWPFLRDRRTDAYAPSSSGGSIEPLRGRARIRRRPPRIHLTAGISHARRVGAARGHLARLASRTHRLAGQIRAHSLGLCRHRATPRARGTRAHPGAGPRREERARAASCTRAARS